jgi:toxin ParE1/3/4
MKVIIRESAYHDLDRIFAWIAADRPRSAASVIDRILESADRLGQFPYMGHVGRAPDTYEWVIPGLPLYHRLHSEPMPMR